MTTNILLQIQCELKAPKGQKNTFRIAMAEENAGTFAPKTANPAKANEVKISTIPKYSKLFKIPNRITNSPPIGIPAIVIQGPMAPDTKAICSLVKPISA